MTAGIVRFFFFKRKFVLNDNFCLGNCVFSVRESTSDPVWVKGATIYSKSHLLQLQL